MAKLAYDVAGPATAPVLLLGPSLGTTIDVWAAQVPILASRYRLVRFDLPGHGASEPPVAPLTMTDLANLVAEIADELDVPRFSYAGVSIGGMIGMALAVAAPERLRQLVLVCTSAYLPPPEGWIERAAVVRLEGPQAVADTVVGRWFTEAYRRSNPADVARFRAMIASTDPEGYATCCEAIAAMDQRDALASVATPTLVIVGRDDPSTPPEHGEAIAHAIPGARATVLDNAAHLANVERAAEVTALMTEFLEGR